MMAHWTERLSEYLDGTLGGAERLDCERHLAECAECRATLDELQRVVARARALEPRAPRADLWAGIASRIGVSRPGVASLAEQRARRHIAFTLPQLAAASIALILLSAGGAWLAFSRGSSRDIALTLAPPPGDTAAAASVSWVSRADPKYDARVAELQQALDAGRERLDSATVRVIEKNLRIIDAAIGQARRALAADPANQYLNVHLADTMRRKLDLLRTASALVNART
jgi:putative zinc finger protein